MCVVLCGVLGMADALDRWYLPCRYFLLLLTFDGIYVLLIDMVIINIVNIIIVNGINNISTATEVRRQ